MKKLINGIINIVVITLIIIEMQSCSKESKEESIIQAPIISTDSSDVENWLKEWKDVSDNYGLLPSYIKVYKSPDFYMGKSIKMYMVLADTKAGAILDVLGGKNQDSTLSEFYKESNASIIINGGYFGTGVSYSLFVKNGTRTSNNSVVLTRPPYSYYPTRGAFGINNDGTIEVNWVYTDEITDNLNPVLYKYPQPSPIIAGTPQPAPDANFPKGAEVWNPNTAMGGGPVLVKNGEYQNTYEEEVFDEGSGVGPLATNPRTAIGYTKEGKIMLLIVEGRNNTPNVAGLDLIDLASIMKFLGAYGAVNLDGGGSSSMLINGLETIIPDKGGRAVNTAISIR